MTCYGKVNTVWYSEATGLPCLFTAGGVTSYLGYISTFTKTMSDDSALCHNGPFPLNLTQQHLKQILHERYNYVHKRTINKWIRDGRFPINHSIAVAPAPICPMALTQRRCWVHHSAAYSTGAGVSDRGSHYATLHISNIFPTVHATVKNSGLLQCSMPAHLITQ